MSARITVLFFILITACASTKAQECFASIPSGTQSVCHGSEFEIPVTLGGTAPFTFTYTINGSPQPPVVTSDSLFTLMLYPPSSNNVIQLIGMQDATGCQGNVSGTMNIKRVSIFVQTFITPVSCSGTGIGTATVSVNNGGTPPYSYLWSTGSSSTQINVPIGIYVVTVTDSHGCTQETIADVVQSEPLSVTGIVTNPTCNHNDGSIDISIAGGSEPYETSWHFGPNTEDLINIGSGNYMLFVTDAHGCTGTYSTTVSTFDVTIQSSVAHCQTSLDVSVNGSIAPYTYLWSNGQTTEDISGLNNGWYTVTVTDAAGCTVNQSFLAYLTIPSATIGVSTNPCTGGLTA